MKEILLEKIKSWSVEKALEFHNDTTLYKDYIWEYSEDGVGVFLYAEYAAWYFDDRAGKVHRLHYRYSADDYNILSSLSKLNELGEIRFDVPIDHSWIHHGDILLEYTEYYRPNRQLGYAFLENMILNIGGKSLEEELINYIEYTSTTIEHFLDLDVKFPIVGLTIANVNVDQIGMFWMNLKTFELDYQEFLLKNLTEFNRDLIACSRVTGKDLSSFYHIAEKSWTK